MSLRSMEAPAFPADAVILATGGIGAIFGRSTNSVICAHYKPEFPARNDAVWLRTTRAAFSGEAPVFSYEEVDISLIKP